MSWWEMSNSEKERRLEYGKKRLEKEGITKFTVEMRDTLLRCADSAEREGASGNFYEMIAALIDEQL